VAKTFYFDSRLGHGSNKGDSPFEALRNADDFNKLLLEPGDRVRFRAGQTFEGTFNPDRSGAEGPGREILIDTYTLGGEPTRWANFPGDATATHHIAWDVNASHIVMRHLQAAGAKYAGFVFREHQAFMIGESLRMRDCGTGARIRGSFTRLTKPDVQGAIMSRFQRKVTDEGGVAFSVEADGWANEENVIQQAFVYGAVAPADEKLDGGGVEIFGDVIGLYVEDCVFMFTKGVVEIGGPSRLPGQTPTTTRNVIFSRNLLINCDLLALFNDPNQDFPIRVKAMRFENNTFYNRTRDLSAVWVNGRWGDLSEITFERNIYSGLGTWIGTNQPVDTNLNSIQRRGNIYHRVGGVSLGYLTGSDDWVGDPGFVNPAGFDLRLKSRPNNGLMKEIPGALDLALSYDGLVDLKWLLKQTRTPLDANNFVGGLHSYPKHRHMWAIPKELRRAGMECAVSDFDQRWRLDADMNTWWQVE
jgi:hypothetical protein